MKGNVRDWDRLSDIIEQCDFVREITNIDKSEFLKNKILQFAVLKSLEIIGEASKQISNETKEEFSELEWREMISARNFYVHEYFEIDLDWVWISVKKNIDFEKIKTYCSHIIEQIKTEL
jgi:uncharacterized protein with HEPN domain